MALEHADASKRGFSASFVNAGAPSGALLGSLMMGLFALLPQEQFFAWGWRIPFLFSGVLLAIGMYVRSKVTESPVFEEAMAKAEAEKTVKQPLPLWAVLRRPKALILVMLGAGAAFGFQVTMATFAQTYAVAVRRISRSSILFAYSAASFLGIFAVALRRPAVRPVRPPPGRCSPAWCCSARSWPRSSAWWGSGNVLLVFLGFFLGPAVPRPDLRPARRRSSPSSSAPSPATPAPPWATSWPPCSAPASPRACWPPCSATAAAASPRWCCSWSEWAWSASSPSCSPGRAATTT